MGPSPLLLALFSLWSLITTPAHVTVSLTPSPALPVQTAFSAAGPYATATGSATISGDGGFSIFRPASYDALGFASPIVTWGNGTGGNPDLYTMFLSHLASYGITVIATNLANTGSGREMDAGLHYLVAEDRIPGNVYSGHLNIHEIAAVGHSQGATGAARVAEFDPAVTTLLTFSLPAAIYSLPNPDCPTAAYCHVDIGLITQPTFLLSTYGPEDAVIDNPQNAAHDFNIWPSPVVMGIIATSGGKQADHSSIEDTGAGGNPAGEIGYATAWLEYRLLGNSLAATAFTGAHPEITANPNWPGSVTRP